eukprot:TRINITY_DN7039_c0_g1_i1.p1 TRINITY_DN7039_c0_g1~~TRINITY_DN7039_c0_g1_i1.p1  ORF type:complete len:469 (-),score=40.31 TRINITY_DN7039_c0_g1_i1:25-1431(-)
MRSFILLFLTVATLWVLTNSLTSSVRRVELRSLTADQRARWQRAFWILRNSTEEEMQSRYGPLAHNMLWFVGKHCALNVEKDGSDAAHFGPNLLTWHRALARVWELTFHAIDPTLPLPYWNSTIDYLLYNDNPKASPVFGDDLLGPDGNPDNLYIVDSGPFAYLPAWKQSEVSNIIKRANPYGFVRDPSNFNPAPYFTRRIGNLWGLNPGFLPPSLVEECLAYPEYWPFVRCVDRDGLHPIIHAVVGGGWGNPNITKNLETLPTFMDKQSYTMGKIAEAGMWLDTLDCVVCDKNCTWVGTDPTFTETEDCRCHTQTNASRVLCKYRARDNPFFPPEPIDNLDDNSWGGRGDMGDVCDPPLDPGFIAHHMYLDLLFAMWQLKHKELAKTRWSYSLVEFRPGHNWNDISGLAPSGISWRDLDLKPPAGVLSTDFLTVKDIFENLRPNEEILFDVLEDAGNISKCRKPLRK